MVDGMANPLPLADSADRDARGSLARIALWVLLFYLAAFFKPVGDLLFEGAMADSDDFLRLHEVMNWMAGQGWYDVSVPRMNWPAGADMHWSRLVDVPIALLAALAGLFTEPVTALRIAALIWPVLVLFATLLTIIAITERIWPQANRLLVVLFALSNIAALELSVPGRIDHHNVQALLIYTAILGLVSRDRPWALPLTGVSITLSLVIGLDNLALVLLLLFWLGLAWALGLRHASATLRQIGLWMGLSLAVLYPVSLPPSAWLTPYCDAISVVYLTLIGLIALCFVALSLVDRFLGAMSPVAAIATRLASGGLAGGGSALIFWKSFPQCMAGPLSAVSPELSERWLSTIFEAQGLIDFANRFGAAHYAVPLFIGVMLASTALLAWRGLLPARALPILAILAIGLVLSFFQIRALRMVVFATVPFCVIFADLIARRVAATVRLAKPARLALTALLCLPLFPTVWSVAADLALPSSDAPPPSPAVAAADEVGSADPDENAVTCNKASQFALLASLPGGTVFNDLNTGPAILVFTPHTIIGGNYHRNERAILDTEDFFEADSETAREIARRRKADYLVYCRAGKARTAREFAATSQTRQPMEKRLLLGNEPAWLERLSASSDLLKVYRIR
ncbi:MAG: hypothetical protein KDJ80_04125 [Nitratireductor sp.]|nr:hypothetical protein [Nitratireductor sp.]